MKSKRKRIKIILYCLFNYATVLSANTPELNNTDSFTDCSHTPITKQWQLFELVNQALCHNPQLQQAWANAQVQAEQLMIAHSNYLPSITLNTNIAHSMNNSNNNSTVSTIGNTALINRNAQALTRITPTINFNYLLYDFGARSGQFANAYYLLLSANWQYQAELQTVLFNVIQSYYQLLAAQALITANLSNQHTSETSLQAAKQRYALGSSPKIEVLQAETAQAQAVLNVQKAQADSQIAKGQLALLLGFSADYRFEIAEPSLAQPSAQNYQDIHHLIEQAKQQHPELLAAEANYQANLANINTAEAGHLPSVSLTANYGYLYTDLPSETQSWAVGVQLSLPLFNGFNTTHQINKAKRQAEAQQRNNEKLAQAISFAVWQAYHLLTTAYQRFQSSEVLLTTAEQTELMSLGRYQAGVGSMLDVLNAQSSLAVARWQVIQNRYDWFIQKAQLAKALGQLQHSALNE